MSTTKKCPYCGAGWAGRAVSASHVASCAKKTSVPLPKPASAAGIAAAPTGNTATTRNLTDMYTQFRSIEVNDMTETTGPEGVTGGVFAWRPGPADTAFQPSGDQADVNQRGADLAAELNTTITELSPRSPGSNVAITPTGAFIQSSENGVLRTAILEPSTDPHARPNHWQVRYHEVTASGAERGFTEPLGTTYAEDADTLNGHTAAALFHRNVSSDYAYMSDDEIHDYTSLPRESLQDFEDTLDSTGVNFRQYDY